MQIEFLSRGPTLGEFTKSYVRRLVLRLGVINPAITTAQATISSNQEQEFRTTLALHFRDGTRLVGIGTATSLHESCEKAIEEVWLILLADQQRAAMRKAGA